MNEAASTSQKATLRVLRTAPAQLEMDMHYAYTQLGYLDDIDAPAGRSIAENIADMGFSGNLVLPPGFGTIYLGEWFCAVLVVTNTSQVPLFQPHIRAEIHTAHGNSEEYTLRNVLDTSHCVFSQGAQGRIDPGQAVSFLIKHDVKHPGRHGLACTVSYALGPDGTHPESFTRMYKFTAQSPLAVRIKSHTLNSVQLAEQPDIFVEVQIHNTTERAMTLHKIMFLPVPSLENVPRNMAQSLLLMPDEWFQYLFHLKEKDISKKQETSSALPLGRLDLEWATGNNDTGRLQTSLLTRKPTAPITTQLVPSLGLSADLHLLNAPAHVPAGSLITVDLSLSLESQASELSALVAGLDALPSFDLALALAPGQSGLIPLGPQPLSFTVPNPVHSKDAAQFSMSFLVRESGLLPIALALYYGGNPVAHWQDACVVSVV